MPNGNTKTLEDFLEDAKERRDDKGLFYGYHKVEYVRGKDEVIFVCPKHGDFIQTPKEHLRNCGCPECAIEDRRLTTKKFIKRANRVHDNLYDYSLANYKKMDDHIKIICEEHGVFTQTPKQHLRGYGCHACGESKRYGPRMSTEEFVKKAKQAHGDKYIYNDTEYKGSGKKVSILCPTHGVFEQSPYHHLNRDGGCTECFYNSRRSNTEEFIEKALEVHEGLYGYDHVEYIDNRTNISIECESHGIFEQTPARHLTGQGCPTCYKIGQSAGWTDSSWEAAGLNSPIFDGFKLYIIKLKPELFKIGITYRPLNRRFREIPYDVEVVNVIISDSAKEICEKEREFKKLCEYFTAEPDKEFGGYYECFSSIDPILPLLN